MLWERNAVGKLINYAPVKGTARPSVVFHFSRTRWCLGIKYYGKVGDIKRIQILIVTHVRKRLGVAHKSNGGYRPALLQSFELTSPLEQYGTFYEHRAAGVRLVY
ncbi:hypothetical protein TNCV_182441 [Trichonephila clavipes]|nr:hypothetical protein TNCV_182441 [Trichonephila clavipes]